MIEWTHVDDQLLAYGTLKNDLLFHKIPKENYLYYINESLKLGKQKAKTYKYLSVEELCQKIILKYPIISKVENFMEFNFELKLN